MASHCAHFPLSPYKTKPSRPSTTPVLLSSFTERRPSYNTLVFQADFDNIIMAIRFLLGTPVAIAYAIRHQAARLLGPPARFDASKLKVVLMEDETKKYVGIVPRTYTLSHCDFTANLTLTISNIIRLDQLKGWYNKDDVVAEWTDVKGDMCPDVHCYVSGPNLLLDLAAGFRYHIFSKELPLVLKAVLHGDFLLFNEHQELMDALVHVYFHSSSKKYNRVECWGPLKDAAQVRGGEQTPCLSSTSKEISCPKIWGSPKPIFQSLVAFLL